MSFKENFEKEDKDSLDYDDSAFYYYGFSMLVVVALPLTPNTNGIITADVLDAIGPTGYFVNVGRGELVDQPALTAALLEGRLGGAGIDVTTPEPLPADDSLWAAPNVIITPHNSGSTDGTGGRADEAFLANLERWVAGADLANEVAP